MVSRHIFNSSLKVLTPVFRVPMGLAAVLCLLMGPIATAEPHMCGITESALKEAAKLRALSPKHPVPCVVRSRPEIEVFLRDTIAKKFPKETLAMEQLWYQAIGIVPDDYPYEKEIVQAYVQQIGGYYDPDRKEFVMLDSMPEKLQVPVAVHELIHALQDQKFGLSHFLDPKERESDDLMARAALVEGDATAIMQEFMTSKSSRSPKGLSEVTLPESVAKIPEALERILLFPYLDGLTFVRHVQRFGGISAINAAFSNPPKTSREVLHPEQYVHRSFKPEELPREDVERPIEKASPIYADTVGEFAVSALLSTALSSKHRGAACAEGWRRDRVIIFKGDSDARFVSWMSEWDSKDESTEFYECYREMIKARYQKDVGGEFVSVSPAKAIKISRSERRVSVLVALGSSAK
jgi:hypothetical protein